MNIENIKLELIDILALVFHSRGFDADLIEVLDFAEELGIDSITFISLIIEIEHYFNIEVPDDYLLIDKLKNLDQIAKMIEKELSAKDIEREGQ